METLSGSKALERAIKEVTYPVACLIVAADDCSATRKLVQAAIDSHIYSMEWSALNYLRTAAPPQPVESVG